MSFFRVLSAVWAALVLSGCANTYSPAFDSLQQVIVSGGGQASIPERPDLRFGYLRVQVDGYPPGLLVLGYVEPHATGPIEVWYSGTLEVLRIQNGRLTGVTGALHDWKTVRHQPEPPAWLELGSKIATFTRRRDVMPGYRFDVQDLVQVEPLPDLPPIKLLGTLSWDKARTYRWFRESVTPMVGRKEVALPDSWFAWGRHRGVDTIVYSHQCLAPDFCLKLQRWPVLEEEP